MNKNYVFRSDRLGFRTWEATDLPLLAALNADPTVMEFFPSTQNLAQTQAFVERTTNHFIKHGYGWYAVDELIHKEFIGFIGLWWNTMDAPFTPCAEIGWRLKQAAWGKGYATEGATRCLQIGFSELELPVIYSFTAVLNKRSERVMQKIGMTKTSQFDHPLIEKGHVLRPHLLYRIEANEMR